MDILIILEPDHSRKDYSAFGDNVEVFFEKWLMNPLLLGYERINQFKPIYISLLKGYIPLFGNKIIETIVSKSRKLIDEKKINIVGKTIIAPHDLRLS